MEVALEEFGVTVRLALILPRNSNIVAKLDRALGCLAIRDGLGWGGPLRAGESDQVRLSYYNGPQERPFSDKAQS